jgi:hypothetical protein
MDILGPFFVIVMLASPAQPESILYWTESETQHDTLEECQEHGEYYKIPIAISAILDWKADLPEDADVIPIGWRCTTQKEIDEDPDMKNNKGIAI